MKLKNVGFFQRHVEKIVLGVGILFLLIVGGMYLLGSPFAVELENRTVPPGEVEDLVYQKAQELEQRLNEEPDLPSPDVPDLSRTFRQMRDQAPLKQTRLATVGHEAMAESLWQPIVGEPQPYYVPRPPIARNADANADYGVLGARPVDAENTRGMDPKIYNQFISIVGEQRPRDFRYVSVSATFDMAEWRHRLQAEPPEPDQANIRKIWWARMLDVTAVYLQRQKRDPVTGEWSEPKIVDALPGQIAFRPDFERQWTNEEAGQVVRLVKQNQPRIQRTDFPPLAHHDWVPPHEAREKLTPQQHKQLQSLNEDISKLERAVRRWERTLNLDAGEEPPSNLGGRRGEIASRLRDDRQEMSELKVQRRELLGVETTGGGQQQDRMQEPRNQPAGWGEREPRRRDARDRRSNRNRARDNNRGRNTRGQTNGDRAEDSESDEPEGQLRVWAHDLSVEPGATYRYRVVVSVLNPLFHQKRGVPQDQQEQYYEQLALGPAEDELQQAEWTEPVNIDQQYYFFLVDGSVESDRAEIEIWRIYDGAWRSQTFDVTPGDPIGGAAEIELTDRTAELNMSVDAVLVDLMAMTSGGPGNVGLAGGTRMLYFDRANQQLSDRTVEGDRESPERLRLQNEAMRRQAVLRQALRE